MKNLNPVIFLGLTENLVSQAEFKRHIRSFTSNLKNFNRIIVCIPSKTKKNNFELEICSKKDSSKFFNDIRLLITDIDSRIKINDFKIENDSIYSKYLEEFFHDISVLYLTIPCDKKLAMSIGKQLQVLRTKNVLLLGIGNIIHKMKKGLDEEITNAVIEFDSWIRVKIFEFDYYALRDFKNYFEVSKNSIFDDPRYYIPFLFIFSSYLGSDELIDIYSGFENNNSLRSFALSTPLN